ncbi:MAG: amino acid racemase [Patescibacteria group bacterium]|nr:amino acid racemase [Patescibacteria group bacterium]
MNKIKQKPIGIIGGMGPDASARLYQLMIKLARLEYTIKTNEDYPEIVLQSIPVPEFISDTNMARRAYLMIEDRVNKLINQNLGCVGISCNTAHMFMDKLRKKSKAKFVSILEEVLEQCIQRGYKRVGLLATPATHKLKLYEKEFEESGIKLVVPKKKEIKMLGEIAEKIVVGEINTAEKKLKKIADGLKSKGSEAIILGCTELPLAFPKNYQLPVLDSVEILARSLLKRYYQ